VIPPIGGWPSDDESRPVLLGLTGPIGCGKSTIAGFLGEIGGVVIDADELARAATQRNSSTLPDIRARFGNEVFDESGALDRAALARIVFADESALTDLERIVHPRVRVLVEEALAAATRDRAPFAVIEAIKLVEGGLADRCDEVWIVECDPATQRSRMSGRGASAQDTERRLAMQGEGLAARLASQLEGRVPVRSVLTEGSPESVRETIEEFLAEALDRPLNRGGDAT
jgi:dephospho-CoA kinase